MSDQVSGENLPATPEAAATKPVAVRKGMWSEGTGDTSGYGGLVRPLPTVTGSTPPFGSYFDAIYERLIEPGARRRQQGRGGSRRVHLVHPARSWSR